MRSPELVCHRSLTQAGKQLPGLSGIHEVMMNARGVHVIMRRHNPQFCRRLAGHLRFTGPNAYEVPADANSVAASPRCTANSEFLHARECKTN